MTPVPGSRGPSPFPGLRPYRFEESHLFFGRDRQVLDLLSRLKANRLLAVLGPSGGGKSSLVRAGLLPSLHGGFMTGSVSAWEVVQFRPGARPLEELRLSVEATLGPSTSSAGASGGEDAKAPAPSGPEPYTSRSLVDWATERGIGGSRGLLVVADQFEEAIRSREESAALLVEMLIAAADQVEVPIYIVLTMRHDYLGECARFPGLPEVLNKSQYLMPTLTREERQEAIEGPLRIAGVSISNRLVQTLLRDSASLGSGRNPRIRNQRRLGDSLPVLQHALFRTFQQWEKDPQGEIDLPHYEAIGGIANALGRHANEIVSGLSKEGRSAAPWIFRALTTADAGRIVRRATTFTTLVSVTGEPGPQVASVVEAFATGKNCLLERRGQTDIVDLLHESLIDNWSELREWALTEARDFEDYVEIRRRAERFAAGDASALLSGRTLNQARARLRSGRMSEAWAEQYDQGRSFGLVMRFIGKSQRARLVRGTLAATAIIALGLAAWAGYRAYQSGLREARDSAAALLREKDAQFQAQLARERELASQKSPGAERDLALANIEIRSLKSQLEAALAGRQQPAANPPSAAALTAAQDRISELERANRDLTAQKASAESAATARVKELEERLARSERLAAATPSPSVLPSLAPTVRPRVTCAPPPPNLPWWEYWEEAKRVSGSDRGKSVSNALAAIAAGPASGDSVPKRDELRDPGGRVTQYFPYRLLAEQLAQMNPEDIAACYEAQPRRKN